MADDAEIIPPNRNPVPRVVEAIATVPWAITEEALDTIVAIALRENEISDEALEAYRGRAVAGHEIMSLRGQTAIITARGPMFRYADFFTSISGAATYDGIAAAVAKAKDDPQIRSVLFSWDSPGGEVNGCAELAGMIAELAAIKPTESYVGGQCCSAAYWLASATSRITIDATAQLGSIGVRMGIRDTSERDAKSGVKTIEFVSSNAPNKRLDWSSDSGRARIQKRADQLEAVFIAAVAKNRGISTDEVIAKFGQGGVEIGADAIQVGLADALGSFEGVVAKLSANGGRTLQGRSTAMSTQANQPGGAPATFTQADIDAAVATAVAGAKADAEKAGAEAAQQRISDILASDEGKANPALANHFAFKTTMSVDDAKAALAAAGPAQASNPAPAPIEGQRAQDAAGGLALSNALDKTGAQGQQQKPAAINPSLIYKKRAETAQAVAKR